ncbi:MAG: hypothetical protein ACKOJF_35870, partial [Planctomycetaceae bacterium]
MRVMSLLISGLLWWLGSVAWGQATTSPPGSGTRPVAPAEWCELPGTGEVPFAPADSEQQVPEHFRLETHRFPFETELL